MKKPSFLLFIILAIFWSCGNDDNMNQVGNCSYNSSVTDVDGNTYNTVLIGSQTWMAENLRTTKFSNGDLIEHYVISCQSGVANSWCCDDEPDVLSPSWAYPYPDDNPLDVSISGRGYNWLSISDSRNICPNGWRVPTLNDWMILAKYVDSNADTTTSTISGWGKEITSNLNDSGGTGLESTSDLWLNNTLNLTGDNEPWYNDVHCFGAEPIEQFDQCTWDGWDLSDLRSSASYWSTNIRLCPDNNFNAIDCYVNIAIYGDIEIGLSNIQSDWNTDYSNFMPCRCIKE